MAATFKMQCILVWICLISAAFPFPTQSPTDADIAKVCCDQNPKLIYQGRDSNSGINVYVFEFLPQGQESKDKRIDDTTMKNDLQGNRNTLKGSENGAYYEDTFIPTNKPAGIYGKKKAPDTETSNIDSTFMPDLKVDTINSTVGAAQNDIAMYEDTGLLSNTTKGLHTGISHTKNAQKTRGQSNGNDYYGTEGSTLDIPGDIDTVTGTQSPNIDFLDKENDFNNRECSESKGQCKKSPKFEDHIFVTQSTPHKDNGYAKREGNTMDRKIKWSETPTKTEKQKKSEKNYNRNINTKEIPIRGNTVKIFQYHRGQRRKTGGKRYNSEYYRHSSSESRSDSSQEFD